MASRYGDFWAMRAAGFTKVAHQRKPRVKWTIILVLVTAWAGFGLAGWLEMRPPSDAVYGTLGALTMSGGYDEAARAGNWKLEIARFTGLSLTAVGLLFGFSGAVGRSFARLLMMGASKHVVIAGESAAALALARSCRAAKDAVVLIARDLQPETAWSLRQSGVILIEGDPTHGDALRSARAGQCDHIVALSDDDTENIRIEAALRAHLPKARRRTLASHVAIRSPLLLQEAREMRMQAQSAFDALPAEDKKKAQPPVIDPRSFSIEEIAARELIATQAPEILDLADAQGREALHIVCFGFDGAAEALAVRALMSLWTVRFGAPKITVLTPKAEDARLQFAARYPNAMGDFIWKADVAFLDLDWQRATIDGDRLARIEAERGPPSAVVVSTGVEAHNIQIALAILRSANMRGIWAAPIYMKETSQSEFSRQYASGDTTPDVVDAYLKAFGAVESIASRDLIVGGRLDRGAAIAQQLYSAGMMQREVDMRELAAVGKTWNGVQETYRNANRAVADAALTKLWDAGWRVAGARDRQPEVHPEIPDATMARLAEIEHGRWVAERLLSGWRPGKRNNRFMMHNNIVPWEELPEENQRRDADQVRAASHIARALNPRGFVRRQATILPPSLRVT